MFVFMHMAKSLKAKTIILYFHTTKKTSKKYVLTCILTLITSLLKSWELGNISKNPKKLFYFLLTSGITNLYVKCILDIKKVVLLLTLGQLGFTR
jgi:hypothetical protein